MHFVCLLSGPVMGQGFSAGSAHTEVRKEGVLRSPAADVWRTPSSDRTPAGCRHMGTAGQPSRPSPLLSSPPPTAQA